MKTTLRNLLLSAATILCAESASAYDFVSGGIYYNVISEDTKTVEVTFETSSYNSYAGSVTVPSSVTNNGTTYTVTAIGSNAFNGCSGLTGVTLPNTITQLSTKSFYGCGMLDSFTIPPLTTTIGERTFVDCIGLTSITIPKSVTEISLAAFAGCYGISKYSVEAGNNNYVDVDGVLYNKDKTTLVAYPSKRATVYSVLDGVKNIDQFSFYKTEVTNVTLPESVETIDYSSFRNCSNLQEINIPKAVRKIGDYAFNRCGALTSDITIPEGVKHVGTYTFYYCTSIKNVTIPSSVDSIADIAFSYCNALETVKNYSKVPQIFGPKSRGFYKTTIANVKLLVPQGTATTYKNTAIWSDFGTIEEFDAASAVETIDCSKPSVIGRLGKISIIGADAEPVEVYSASGALIYKGSEKEISVPCSGLYIVKLAQQAHKIIVNN